MGAGRGMYSAIGASLSLLIILPSTGPARYGISDLSCSRCCTSVSSACEMSNDTPLISVQWTRDSSTYRAGVQLGLEFNGWPCSVVGMIKSILNTIEALNFCEV